MMKKSVFYILFCLSGFSFLLTGCFKDDFSTSPGDNLAFSIDTLKFDTIFTEKGTATLTFRVYNRGKKALRIESVVMADAANSKFFFNIDGSKGPEIRDLEINGKDSLYVFVEANVDPRNANSPVLIKDSIVFTTNGVRQDVKIEAYGQDVEVLRGKVLEDAQVTFTGDKPYLIYDSLVIGPSTELKLSEGTTLYFHSKARMEVKGRLLAEGTLQRPVALRGDRLDRMFSDLPYDYLAGQWGGIRFHQDSYDNRFNYVYMRGSSSGIAIDSSDVSRKKIIFSNSIIHNSKNNLVTSTESNISAWNCQFSNAGGALLSLAGGKADLTHCTIVNYYKILDFIKSPLLVFDRYTSVMEEAPLQVDFRNCIITGNYSLMQPDDVAGMQVYFRNCLFQVKGTDDDNFINCVWDGDPMFVATGDEHYIYDFRPGSDKSAAYQTGDPSFLTNNTYLDMLGVSRRESVKPDIGAYQFVKSE